MTSLFAIAGLIGAAALTPGPNNLIVLRAATRGGIANALPAIGGIVSGGLVLLGAVIAGTAGVFARWPRLPTVLACVGAAYLAWLGVRMMKPQPASSMPSAAWAASSPALPAGIVGVFAFQFLNPKGWIMALTAVAAAQADAGTTTHWQLAALFLLIPLSCLLAWSALGVALGAALRRPATRHRFDRAMGVLLLACAVLLFPSP